MAVERRRCERCEPERQRPGSLKPPCINVQQTEAEYTRYRTYLPQPIACRITFENAGVDVVRGQSDGVEDYDIGVANCDDAMGYIPEKYIADCKLW